MRKTLKIILIIFVITFLGIVSLQSVSNTQEVPEQLNIQTLVANPQEIEKSSILDINDLPIKDNPDVYQYDQPGSVEYMYVTVRKGNPSDNTDHTWQEVNDFTKFFFEKMEATEVGKAEVIFQIGDENGPIAGEIGFNETIPNGSIKIRGGSSSLNIRKSYKIELYDRAGLWRGQSSIALNKHLYDPIRVRNKLCFDLMKDIPDLTSLRTQFVHLFVKDETSDPISTVFEDYGLFTQIEQPNRKFLENHLLDRNGQLYKTTFFEFFRYEDKLRLADDPLYDLNAFEEVLEIKGNKDHTKLIQMLEDLNDYSIPIEDTFSKYFDEDNYFTWNAFNILIGNLDTDAQNYYLYSPQNGEKWYFLPWDYDTALTRQYREELGFYPLAEWEKGISNSWGNILHNRVFKIEKYRDALSQKIEMLRQYLTEDRIQTLLETYKPVTDQFVTSLPDSYYFPVTLAEYNYIHQIVPLEIQLNYDLYLESLTKPMPFYMDVPEVSEGLLVFSWDPAFDFNAQDMVYTFQVSRDWDFIDLVAEQEISDIFATTVSTHIPMPASGNYFWRVIATNTDGKSQIAYDTYWDAESNPHYGTKYFYLDTTGNISEQPSY